MKRAMVLKHYYIRMLIGWLVVILMLNVVFCQWPPQAPSMPNPTLDPTMAIDAIEVPESACIGRAVTITVKTAPGNECLATVVYTDTSDDGIWLKLKPAVADGEGLCTWTWWVPEDASVGVARVRVVVMWGDERSHSLAPRGFHIEDCSE